MNGIRVELGVIDHALRSNPEVDQAFVVAHPMADGENALACYYTEKSPIDPRTLRERLGESLPQAMIPQYFVKLEAFPLNINGKIDARALPKPEDLDLRPHPLRGAGGRIETRLAAIWSESLGSKRVGVKSLVSGDRGNSLRAIRIISRISREFGLNVTIREFFRRPTIRMLAEHIREAIRKAAAG